MRGFLETSIPSNVDSDPVRNLSRGSGWKATRGAILPSPPKSDKIIPAPIKLYPIRFFFSKEKLDGTGELALTVNVPPDYRTAPLNPSTEFFTAFVQPNLPLHQVACCRGEQRR